MPIVPPAALRAALLGATLLAGSAGLARADIDDGIIEATGQTLVPSGQMIFPTAATGAVFQTLNPNLPDMPNFAAYGAIKTAINPDGTELLVLTSGYNNQNFTTGTHKGQQENADSDQYVFVYDITGSNKGSPAVKQVIKLPDSYVGLAFAPDGLTFYVSGGSLDSVYAYSKQPREKQYRLTNTIALNHSTGVGFFQGPTAAGLAVSPSGLTLAVANIYNDSVSIIDTTTGKVKFDYDLRPYNTSGGPGVGKAGGETPFTVALKGDTTLYVSSVRDREVVVLDIGGSMPTPVTRIALPGSPNSMIFNNTLTQDKLFVAQDNSDNVAVIDTANNKVTAEIDTIAPPGLLAQSERYTGAAANNLAISPDGQFLYVTNGGANSLAVVALTGSTPYTTVGLIPTGWYPNAVSVSADGSELYVVNAKSDPGPNPLHLTGSTYALTGTMYPGGNNQAEINANAANQYVYQLEQAGLLALPTPAARDLKTLTGTVAANNRYRIAGNPHDAAVMAALHAKIQHVIYIVKENRTFDQVFGDLTNGANADPSLTVFGRTVTPNFHALQENFVTLDNFLDSGEVSGDGWAWSVSGRENDMVTKTIPLDYSNLPTKGQPGRAAPYETEGQNRNVDIGIGTLAGREQAEPLYAQVSATLPGGTANLLPGTNNDGAPDGPNGLKQGGYIWDAALRAGLTVRNYGFYCDLGRYGGPTAVPELPNPYAAGVQVAFNTNPTLRPNTDPYFRSFDNAFPDVYRYQEWAREFDAYVTGGNLPSLSLVRLMHDHMGSFGSAIDGFNTPEIQQADNDYAVGLLVQRVASSPYAGNTLIFVIEDDAQDGPDHVDAHRSTAYVVGPYVKHRKVVSTRYTTVNMVRTIEDVLGIDHLNLNDAYQPPMTDVFDLNQSGWNFQAMPSAYLQNTTAELLHAPGVQFADKGTFRPTHDAAYWEAQTEGFDWSAEDRVPALLFNQIVWEGVFGTPYPMQRSGLDLRRHTLASAE